MSQYEDGEYEEEYLADIKTKDDNDDNVSVASSVEELFTSDPLLVKATVATIPGDKYQNDSEREILAQVICCDVAVNLLYPDRGPVLTQQAIMSMVSIATELSKIHSPVAGEERSEYENAGTYSDIRNVVARCERFDAHLEVDSIAKLTPSSDVQSLLSEINFGKDPSTCAIIKVHFTEYILLHCRDNTITMFTLTPIPRSYNLLARVTYYPNVDVLIDVLQQANLSFCTVIRSREDQLQREHLNYRLVLEPQHTSVNTITTTHTIVTEEADYHDIADKVVAPIVQGVGEKIAGAVNVLSDQVFKQAVPELQQRIIELKTAINLAEERAKKIKADTEQKFKQVEDTITQVKTDAKNLKSETDTRFGQTAQFFKAVDEQFTDVQHQFRGVEQQLSEMRTSMEQNFSHVQQQIDEQLKNIELLNQDILELRDSDRAILEELQRTQENMTKKFADIEESFKNIQEQLESLREEWNLRLEQSILQVRQELATTREEIDEVFEERDKYWKEQLEDHEKYWKEQLELKERSWKDRMTQIEAIWLEKLDQSQWQQNAEIAEHLRNVSETIAVKLRENEIKWQNKFDHTVMSLQEKIEELIRQRNQIVEREARLMRAIEEMAENISNRFDSEFTRFSDFFNLEKTKFDDKFLELLVKQKYNDMRDVNTTDRRDHFLRYSNKYSVDRLLETPLVPSSPMEKKVSLDSVMSPKSPLATKYDSRVRDPSDEAGLFEFSYLARSPVKDHPYTPSRFSERTTTPRSSASTEPKKTFTSSVDEYRVPVMPISPLRKEANQYYSKLYNDSFTHKSSYWPSYGEEKTTVTTPNSAKKKLHF
jgi:hypothetical protein